jgi:hypothetical protein
MFYEIQKGFANIYCYYFAFSERSIVEDLSGLTLRVNVVKRIKDA